MAAAQRPQYFRTTHPEVPYRTVLVEGAAPAAASGLRPTPFLVAERTPGNATLVILPGFGVSIGRIGVDRLLWYGSERYCRIITHDAVNYDTSIDYLIWQYRALLSQLPPSPINMFGMSLGGATAIELLSHLHREEGAIYSRCAKLLTLVAAINEDDYHPRWRRVLQLMRVVVDARRAGSDVGRLLRSTMLKVIVRAITPRLRRSDFEVDTTDEIIGSFRHMAESYERSRPRPAPGSLPGIEIVSVGIAEDHLVANARACRYAERPGRHLVCAGRHAPDFYSYTQDQYDRMILAELG